MTPILEQALIVLDTVNKNAFLSFLESVLLPTLAEGRVLVLDNWSIHHVEEVRELVERFGCELLYLPTYSPDLVLDKAAPPGPVCNPTEHLFAKIKAFIKSLRPDTLGDLIQAFCDAVKTVTPMQVLNTFEHCGYELEH